VDAFGAFYLHSDSHAVTKLLNTARQHDDLQNYVATISGTDIDVDAIDTFLRCKSHNHHEALLELLVDPRFIGCGHVRLMSQFPEEYGVRPGLVTDFLRAFFTMWWDGSPELYFTVLGGEHNEAAVLQVIMDKPVWTYSRIPLLSPSFIVDGTPKQMFVNHPEVIAFMRSQIATFLTTLDSSHPAHLPVEQVATFNATITSLGSQAAGATLQHLAAGLPIFQAICSGDKALIRVTRVGVV
jgi:hypothetical protein